jgi:hypothetical protein
LLRSESNLPHAARIYLADLIERYEFARPAHRPRIPAYDMSVVEMLLLMGNRRVRDYVYDGLPVREAVTKACKDLAIPEDQEQLLADHYANKRASSRRMKKRRAPITR